MRTFILITTIVVFAVSSISGEHPYIFGASGLMLLLWKLEEIREEIVQSNKTPNA